MIEAMPPNDRAAELAVVGSCILDSDVIDDLVLILRPDDFYDAALGSVYGACVRLHEAGKRPDERLLLAALTKAGQLDRTAGGEGVVAECVLAVPHARNASHYGEIVFGHATSRAITHAGHKILEVAHQTTEARERLAACERLVFGIADERGRSAAVSMADLLPSVMDTINARCAGEIKAGLPTTFRDVDDLTGGMRKGELIILAARTSMGKTAFAVNLADRVSDNGGSVLYVSLEMGRLEVGERVLIGEALVNSHKMRNGMLNPDEIGRLVEAHGRIAERRLVVDDSPIRNVSEIAAECRRMKRRDGIDLLLVDYLQLVRPDGYRESREQQVANITRRFKAVARDLDIPVLVLAQLNRQVEASAGNMPKLSHLRESGAIEQDADQVWFLHRPAYFMPANAKDAREDEAYFIAAKNRGGQTGKVELEWQSNYMRFETVIRKSTFENGVEFCGDTYNSFN